MDSFGFYTWETVATVNATDRRVVAYQRCRYAPKELIFDEDTGEFDAEKQLVALSLVGQQAKSASSIYWDPEAGISYCTIRRGRLQSLWSPLLCGWLSLKDARK